MASSADLTAHSPLARIPKLKYRNPLPAEGDAPPLQPSNELSAHIQERPVTSDSNAASTSSRLSFETASLTSSSLASTPSSAASSNDSKSSKKKKKANSVLGFLSLKEPSQVALEQFAEHQRKQTASKGSSTPTSRHSSNFVGKQLPSNVPKVNSKWDGVPAGAKNRHSIATMSTVSSKDNTSNSSSRGSLHAQFKTGPWNDSKLSVMTDGTRNPPNSIASPATSMSNLTIRDQNPPYGSSPSTTTLPEMSYYFPDAPIMSGVLPTNSFNADGSQEPGAGPQPRRSDDTFDSSSSPEGPAGLRADSPASSTDSVDTIVRDTADVIFKKLNDRPNQSFWGGETLTVQPSDETESAQVPDSHDFLFGPPSTEETPKNDSPMASPLVSHYVPPRPVQNFSRPIAPNSFVTPMHRPATYRSTPSSSALPTLYEASLASTDSLATVQDDEDSRSIAPSSIAPSELSGHWYESPRERLGLGGRIRKNDILPWDDQGRSLGKPKKNRLSMFGIGTARV
ncbi:Nn.00g054370.m01.CDS01 [Neocucurbitaria sp. VM-36]